MAVLGGLRGGFSILALDATALVRGKGGITLALALLTSLTSFTGAIFGVTGCRSCDSLPIL